MIGKSITFAAEKAGVSRDKAKEVIKLYLDDALARKARRDPIWGESGRRINPAEYVLNDGSSRYEVTAERINVRFVPYGGAEERPSGGTLPENIRRVEQEIRLRGGQRSIFGDRDVVETNFETDYKETSVSTRFPELIGLPDAQDLGG